jgi:hypothetical protein
MIRKINIVIDNWHQDKEKPLEPHMANFFFNYGMQIKKYRLSEIKKYPNKDFYLFIDNMEKHKLDLSLLNSDTAIKNSNLFTIEIIKYWKNCKNLNIVLFNCHESICFNSVFFYDKWTKIKKLNQKQLYIANNNKQLYEYKDKLKSNINFYVTNAIYSIIDIESVNEDDFIHNKKGKFFLFYNNRLREHRAALLLLLLKNNLIGNIDWSMLTLKDNAAGIDHDFNYLNGLDFFLEEKTYNNLKKEINYLKKIKIKYNEYEKNLINKNLDNLSNLFHTSYMKGFKNSYINITTESTYDTEYYHISEKTFKPFLYFHFPLILAPHHFIKHIKEIYNFDMFDDIIDHSYDNVFDHKKRLMCFVDEIKRINNNKEKFIDFYTNNKDRFIKNHKIIKNLSIEDEYNNFYNKLIKK